jgi:hypothetical protein
MCWYVEFASFSRAVRELGNQAKDFEYFASTCSRTGVSRTVREQFANFLGVAEHWIPIYIPNVTTSRKVTDLYRPPHGAGGSQNFSRTGECRKISHRAEFAKTMEYIISPNPSRTSLRRGEITSYRTLQYVPYCTAPRTQKPFNIEFRQIHPVHHFGAVEL